MVNVSDNAKVTNIQFHVGEFTADTA